MKVYVLKASALQEKPCLSLGKADMWELIGRGLAFVTPPGEVEGSDHGEEDLLC